MSAVSKYGFGKGQCFFKVSTPLVEKGWARSDGWIGADGQEQFILTRQDGKTQLGRFSERELRGYEKEWASNEMHTL